MTLRSARSAPDALVRTAEITSGVAFAAFEAGLLALNCPSSARRLVRNDLALSQGVA